MDILLVRDGTVPMAIARLLAQDGTVDDLIEFLADRDGDLEAEMHKVEDGSTYIGACWFDGDGFTLVGFNDVREAFEWLADDGLGIPVKTETYSPGHWGATYPSGNPDDPRGYGHVFAV